MAEHSERFLTPREIAKLLRVRTEKVVGWIRRAELRAVNVGDGARHQYRVSRDDLEAFISSREIQAPPAHWRRQRQAPKGGPLEEGEGKRLEKLGKAKLVAGTSPPRLVALTAYGEESDKAEAANAGFDAYFCKPADWQELEAVLVSYLPN